MYYFTIAIKEELLMLLILEHVSTPSVYCTPTHNCIVQVATVTVNCRVSIIIDHKHNHHIRRINNAQNCGTCFSTMRQEFIDYDLRFIN